ncbi:Crp/Fnr family transcriptional regulator [Shewanella woodyi]|uniref:Transcriptional regulator, Crp/Fnr family n=1 Tax=Shewanella woodyi (strain ATCC 51908 / MS32) TaxID=392500 RepID=B1KL01_SHEWM|nr:Crp/Fnr family transcriptional regulator [Shewanella woodyi]ACA88807.1 transcriptional regulator, Crp/Fnr family [Shewanella woodyi ATCC 51908]
MSPNRQSLRKYSQEELTSFLAYSGVFSVCSQDEIDYILSQLKTNKYKNETVIAHREDVGDQVRFVINGSLNIVATSLDGKEVRFPPIGPQRWVGWISCFDNQILSHDWVATAKSEVISVPGAVIRKLCENNPALYPKVMTEINRQFKLLMSWTEFVSLHSLTARVRMLVQILAQISATPMDDQPGWLQVDVTQEHLASFLNLSRQTANKLLVELEKEQIISIGYRKILINSEKLPNLAS